MMIRVQSWPETEVHWSMKTQSSRQKEASLKSSVVEYKGTLLSQTEAKVRPDLTYWHIVLMELNTKLKLK